MAAQSLIKTLFIPTKQFFHKRWGAIYENMS